MAEAEFEIRNKRSAKLTFTQSVLILEAFAVLFATLAVWGLSRGGALPIGAGATWGIGFGTIIAMFYASSLQRKRWGQHVGSALQAPMLIAGLAVPTIGVIGVLFLIVWIVAIRLGNRIDRERAAFDEKHPGETQESYEARLLARAEDPHSSGGGA